MTAGRAGQAHDAGGESGLTVRELAVRTLYRVNHQGAWSNVLIDNELSRSRLADHDRGLFLHLVRGSLERQGTIDWVLTPFVNRPLAALDPWPREILRVGTYQLLYLDVPDFAAVDTSVSLAKRLAGAHVAGLVNAVLRRVAAGKDRLPWPDPALDPVTHLAVTASHPQWLVQRWVERFGLAEAAALCAANNNPPGVTIRTNLMRTTRAALLSALSAQGFGASAGELAPEAIHIDGGGDLFRTAEYAAGHFIIQDQASMVAARAVAPRPGERIVDACAAPGGKTTHLAALAGDEAQVLAVDVNRAKLSQVRARANRLGLRSITLLEGDARQLGTIVPGRADAALIDAPCSGLGVIRRRPELRWRRTVGDLTTLARQQLAILTGVASAIKPGGRLVYSVCSFEPEETDDVVADFIALDGGRTWQVAVEPRVLLPHRDRSDGFFFVGLRRSQ